MLRALAKLYEYDTDDENDITALEIYLKIQDPDIFDLIEKRRNFKYARDKVMSLMNLDQERATKLFVENYNQCNELPVKLICQKLGRYEF